MEKKKIAIVEDEAILALQIRNEVLQMGHAITGVYASGRETLEGIRTVQPDLILMDIKIKGDMDGIETADLIRKDYDIPVIYITAHSEKGTIEKAKITEPYAYLLKPVNANELQIAIEIGLHKHKIDMEKAQLTKELQHAIEKVKLLSGMLPICCGCKKIRNDRGYWEQIEVYISEHSEAEFSHGLCPECVERLYPEEWEQIKKKHQGG